MGIESFLSEENLSLHRGYLDALRLKKQMAIQKADIRRIEKEILSHELYFSSFRKERVRCDRVRAGYGSESRFCFALKEYAERFGAGFLYIFDLPRFPYVGFGREEGHLCRAVLSVDLFEHAYFFDYAFDFSAYLEAALSHLDLARLDGANTQPQKGENA